MASEFGNANRESGSPGNGNQHISLSKTPSPRSPDGSPHSTIDSPYKNLPRVCSSRGRDAAERLATFNGGTASFVPGAVPMTANINLHTLYIHQQHNYHDDQHYHPEAHSLTPPAHPEALFSSPDNSPPRPKRARSLNPLTTATVVDAQVKRPTRRFVQTSKARRVRTGCFTCRDRHVKCDEGAPVCNNCLKSNRQCKRGVRLNFAETNQQVKGPPRTVPRGKDWLGIAIQHHHPFASFD